MDQWFLFPSYWIIYSNLSLCFKTIQFFYSIIIYFTLNYFAGLAFDDWDLDYYTKLFLDKLKRNPTSVECFDLAQSNSERRHWFFKGRVILDGKEEEKWSTLIDMIIDTQNYSNLNNVIKFSDNSSAIEGFQVPVLRPVETHKSSHFDLKDIKQHLIFTAERHNFPTGVAPFR